MPYFFVFHSGIMIALVTNGYFIMRSNILVQHAAILMVASTVLLSVASASGQEQDAVSSLPEHQARSVGMAMNRQGRVESISFQSRTAVVLWSNGVRSTFQAPPKGNNFDNVKVGDGVLLTVATTSVQKLHIVSLDEKEGVFTIKDHVKLAVNAGEDHGLGLKPFGIIEKQVRIVGRLYSVDLRNSTAFIQTPEGVFDVNVTDRPSLKMMALGSPVSADITEAVTLEVTAGPSK